MKPKFKLISELHATIRRDFGLADESVLNPFGARPLVEGEFLELTSDYKLGRGGNNDASDADECVNPNVYVVHTERGRSDTQVAKMTNVIYFGMYEAETDLVVTTSLVLGSELTVQDIDDGGIVRRGLAIAGATAGRVVVGYVSKLYAGTNRVRFVHFGNLKK